MILDSVAYRSLYPMTIDSAFRYILSTLFLATVLAVGPALAQSCTGDCNDDGDVTVDEILIGVNIALGVRPFTDCLALDANDDSTVTVDEIITALNLALTGCNAAATPTPAPPTSTPTDTATATPTHTASATPTNTEPPSIGPEITFFGVARADGTIPDISGEQDGIPIYERPAPFGFLIVAEGRSGASGGVLGQCNSSYDPFSPAVRPSIQILSNRNLGNGNPAVCDGPIVFPTGFGCGERPPVIVPMGGIPGFDPPDFDPASQAVADALNDFGCRMTYLGPSEPCTKSDFGNPRYVDTRSTDQFCSGGTISADMRFPPGDTMLVARWLDSRGNLGAPARMIIRIP